MKHLSFFLFLLFFAGDAFFISAQETEEVREENAGDSEENRTENQSNTIFYIRNTIFDITGRTRESALARVGEFKQGEKITGQAALEKYIKNKEQDLKNMRTLESASINYALGDPDSSGTPVDLFITTTDTRNFIALPEPKYSSNSGFDIELKVRDYNFLGTLNPLRFDIGYILESENLWDWSKGIFSFSIDSDIPFNAFGLEWNFDFDHDFKYTFEEPLYYKNTSGISLNVPWRTTTFTFGFEENFIVNEKNAEVYYDKFGKYEPFYMTSELYTSWRIPLGIEVGNFGQLAYTPKVSGKTNYTIGGINELRKGFFANLSHSFSFGRVNWIGNYRDGLDVSLSNSNSYNFLKNDWSVNYGITAKAYKKIADFFGVSSRARFTQWLFFTEDYVDGVYAPSYTTVGDMIRGVKDDSIIAEHKGYMLSFNFDFPLRILHFVPSEWFNVRALRFFNFDMHLSPFIDIGYLQGRKNASWASGRVKSAIDSHFFSSESLFGAGAVGAGAELIVFPLTWRSLYLRLSVGYNVNKILQTMEIPTILSIIPKWDEIFIGVGHQY